MQHLLKTLLYFYPLSNWWYMVGKMEIGYVDFLLKYNILIVVAIYLLRIDEYMAQQSMDEALQKKISFLYHMYFQ